MFRNIAVILFVVCLSVPVYSQQTSQSVSDSMPQHEMGMMGMRGKGMPSDQEIDRSLDTLQRTLNLTPAQVVSIGQLARSRRESIRGIREQAKPKFEQLMSMLRQPNPDPAAVGRVVLDLKGIHEQVRAKQTDFETQLSGILNPTQEQTVTNLRNQAQTFAALRNIGLVREPEFPRGPQAACLP